MRASQLNVAFILSTFVLVACGDRAQDPLAPAMSPQPAAAVLTPALPFNGSLVAAETHTHLEDLGFTAHITGNGTAAYLGRFTLDEQQLGSIATLTADGTLVLTAANGDQLYGSGSAQATPSEDFSMLRVVEMVSIKGGTGRFQGASGSFTWDRMVDIAGGSPYASTGTITGSIILAH